MAESTPLQPNPTPSGGAAGTLATPALPPPSSDFPPFDPQYWTSQIVWLAILFGALYLAMSRVALPRVAGILETRRHRIDSDFGAADAARQAADAQKASYEQLLAQARERAQAQGQETHARLAAESEARRKDLDRQLAEKLAAADRQIENTKARAMENVASVAREAAAAIVERLLGRPVDASAVDRVFSK